MTTKQRYERNELIEWVNLIEEAKSIGLTPEEVRNFIEEETK
jgi:DNA-binding transcriptional MerR regulator